MPPAIPAVVPVAPAVLPAGGNQIVPSASPTAVLAIIQQGLMGIGYTCRADSADTIFCERTDRLRLTIRYTTDPGVGRLILTAEWGLRQMCPTITTMTNQANYGYNIAAISCENDGLRVQSSLLVPVTGMSITDLDSYLAWWSRNVREILTNTGIMALTS